MSGYGSTLAGPAPHRQAEATVGVFQGWTEVTEDFDREVDDWLDDLEGHLAPAGRVTPPPSTREPAQGTLHPILSHPSTLAPHRSAVPGLRRGPELETEPGPETVGLERREAQLVAQRGELVRTEALVDVMKELAVEIRSVRRDVDQIKAVITKLRRLAEAKRRRMGPPAPLQQG
jgi:hypothetical protein